MKQCFIYAKSVIFKYKLTTPRQYLFTLFSLLFILSGIGKTKFARHAFDIEYINDYFGKKTDSRSKLLKDALTHCTSNNLRFCIPYSDYYGIDKSLFEHDFSCRILYQFIKPVSNEDYLAFSTKVISTNKRLKLEDVIKYICSKASTTTNSSHKSIIVHLDEVNCLLAQSGGNEYLTYILHTVIGILRQKSVFLIIVITGTGALELQNVITVSGKRFYTINLPLLSAKQSYKIIENAISHIPHFDNNIINHPKFRLYFGVN